MGYDPGAFLDEIQKASERIERGNTRMDARLDGFEREQDLVKRDLNRLLLAQGRPPGFSCEGYGDGEAQARKWARQLVLTKHQLDSPGAAAREPSGGEIEAALGYKDALLSLARAGGEMGRLSPIQTKSLTIVNYGANSWLVPAAEVDEDGEVRIGDSDRVFFLQECGAPRAGGL